MFIIRWMLIAQTGAVFVPVQSGRWNGDNYSLVRVGLLIFVQTGNCLTLNMRAMLRKWAKIQSSCTFFSIVWTIANVCLGGVLYLQVSKCCCTDRFVLGCSSWGNSWVRWPNLVIVCCFIPLRGYLAADLYSGMEKARLTWDHWNGLGTGLSTKGRAYTVPELLCGSATWPLRVEDLRRPLVFEHRRLADTGRICWKDHVSDSEVRRKVLDSRVHL